MIALLTMTVLVTVMVAPACWFLSRPMFAWLREEGDE